MLGFVLFGEDRGIDLLSPDEMKVGCELIGKLRVESR
jgi:hypothetical protein